MIAGGAMKLVMWKEGTSNPECLREIGYKSQRNAKIV